MAQDWEFAGVNLTTPAYTVQYLGASPNTPARRGEDLTIPGKTGRYLTTGKKLDSRTVSLAMWVKDLDPSTGNSMGTAAEAQLQTNLDTLRKLIATEGTALLKHTMGGTTRQVPAEIINAVDFEPFGTAPYYRFVVEWSLADPLWRAEAARTIGPTNLTTNPQNVTLVNNGTYRNEHATITLIAPGTVVDPKFAIGSTYVEYTGTVSGGGTLAINCSTWTATNGTADVSGDITHNGDLVWLPIPVGTAVTCAVSAGTIVGTPTVTASYLERFV